MSKSLCLLATSSLISAAACVTPVELAPDHLSSEEASSWYDAHKTVRIDRSPTGSTLHLASGERVTSSLALRENVDDDSRTANAIDSTSFSSIASTSQLVIGAAVLTTGVGIGLSGDPKDDVRGTVGLITVGVGAVLMVATCGWMLRAQAANDDAFESYDDDLRKKLSLP